MNLDVKEVLRYLAQKSDKYDDMTIKTINLCIEELMNVISPKAVYKKMPIFFHNDFCLSINNIEFNSTDLYKHLNQCEDAYIFAATLGVQADILIKKNMITNITKAVIMQACCTMIIEAFCDDQQDLIRDVESKEGFFLRPRFSPGYGDFSLDFQNPLVNSLNGQKEIGLTVMESKILAPSKSVTAIIGITKDSTTCHISKCMTCKSKNCTFRKES